MDLIIAKFFDRLSISVNQNKLLDIWIETINDYNTVINIPPNIKDRNIGQKYKLKNGEIIIWSGKIYHCIHNKRKRNCIMCEGTSVCEHKKQRATCTLCKGSQICEHSRHKARCFECKGSQICEHKHQKDSCKLCGNGNQLCEHKRVKASCKECKGSAFCPHKIAKRDCVKCRGSGICIHKKRRRYCKDCQGSQICEHKTFRARCKELPCRKMEGSQICEHIKNRYLCVVCTPNGKNFCNICQLVYVKGCPYYPLCFRCYCYEHPDEPIPRRYKMKEHIISDMMKDTFTEYKFQYDRTISGGCSNKRPDAFCDLLTHSLIIEYDENQHNQPAYGCDERRTMELFADLCYRPLVMIRINPDTYMSGKVKYPNAFTFDDKNVIHETSEWQRRWKIIKEKITYHLENIPTMELTTIKLFFDE